MHSTDSRNISMFWTENLSEMPACSALSVFCVDVVVGTIFVYIGIFNGYHAVGRCCNLPYWHREIRYVYDTTLAKLELVQFLMYDVMFMITCKAVELDVSASSDLANGGKSEIGWYDFDCFFRPYLLNPLKALCNRFSKWYRHSAYRFYSLFLQHIQFLGPSYPSHCMSQFMNDSYSQWLQIGIMLELRHYIFRYDILKLEDFYAWLITEL